MPQIQREVVIALPIGQVWEFISDMNEWARNLPGYCTHEMKSETESIWRLKGDVGILSREVDLRVTITEWADQIGVKFTLKGVYEPVEGKGQVGIIACDLNQTKLIIEMELKATGLMGPIINALLGKVITGMGDEFITSLSAELLKRKEIRRHYDSTIQVSV